MRSFMSLAAEYFLRFNGYKKKINDVLKMSDYLEERHVANEKVYEIPASVRMKSKLKKETVDTMDVYYINKNEKRNKLILYFHGGGYVEQPVAQHWQFLDKIALATDAEIIVPIYPKAPEYQYMESIERLLTIYQSQLSNTDAGNIIFMGDSAGGGLALALAEYLLESELPQPAKIILLSPWLDITMENTDIQSLDAKDPSLGIYGLIQMGKAWAGTTDAKHYLLSPLYGKILGLGKISVFVGEHELFLADARKFRDFAKSQNVEINYYEYPKMNHVFPLYPIPEARKAQKQIIDIINGRIR